MFGVILKLSREPSTDLNPSNGVAMTSEPIRFTDGAAYDRFMGVWSRLAGQDFLEGASNNQQFEGLPRA